MKKFIALGLILIIPLIWIINKDRAPQEETIKEITMIKNLEASRPESKKILPFKIPPTAPAPSFEDLERRYQALEESELEKELSHLDQLAQKNQLIELANRNKLTVQGKHDLLIYLRARAVILALLFDSEAAKVGI
ncbi:MAG: hypothetical protein AB7I27_00055 [Bacteriovoracaceae bacterium]